MLAHYKIGLHLLSVGLAVFVIGLAGLQAILLSLQEKQLRNKHIVGLMNILPPLETMEVLLFRLIACGFFLLTFVLLTSFYFFSHEILSVYLLSKILFVILAWIFFAILLVGRHWFGLRGKKAIYGTLSAVLLVIVITIISRLAMELSS